MDSDIQKKPADPVHLVRGNRYEDFTPGRVFEHSQRRTVLESDNALFTTLTLHYNPLYLDREEARAAGHADIVVNPLLVFNMVFGISVEDLSEGGGPFLGVENLDYGVSVHAGDTIHARSTVVAARLSGNRPDFGIVTWETQGFNQRGEQVITFRRSNLARRGR